VSARRAQKAEPTKEPVRLSSGARLFVEPDPVIPLVDVDVVLRGGSIHDLPGRQGLSRIFARLVRRGTAASAPVFGSHGDRPRGWTVWWRAGCPSATHAATQAVQPVRVESAEFHGGDRGDGALDGVDERRQLGRCHPG